MKNLLFGLYFFSPAFSADLSPFEGVFFHPSNQTEINFIDVGGAVTGIYTIEYVNEYGDKTGETLTYYYSFNQLVNPNKVQGSLKSFDSHYQCDFNHGKASLELLPDNNYKLVFPKIVFKVVKTYQSSGKRSHYYGSGNTYNKNPSHIECVITSRLVTGAILHKL